MVEGFPRRGTRSRALKIDEAKVVAEVSAMSDMVVATTNDRRVLGSGMSEAEILADFPDLTSDDIRACLAFAADRERRLLSIPVA